MITLSRHRKASREIDLHSHSWYSDGALAPADLVHRMKLAGIGLAALTDHDTLDGVPEFQREAKTQGLRTISGVEVSLRANRVEGAPEVHVLVYGIEPGVAEFESFLDGIRQARIRRITGMVEKLTELGMPLDMKRLESDASRGSLGRPHLAKLLIDDGHVSSIHEAFQRYLADHRPGWLPKELPDVSALIALAHKLGGLCVLAHPGKALPQDAARILIDQGLDGLEIRHPAHRSHHQQFFHDLARRNGLSSTAGSDFHDPKQGRYRAPDWTIEEVGGKLISRLQS